MAEGRQESERETPRSQRIRVIYRSRPENPPPAAATSTDSEEEDHDNIAIPSNQLAVPPPAPTASPSYDRPHGSRDYPNPIAIPTEETQEEEDDGWSFLTQFIGPPPSDDRRPNDGGIATTIVDQERTHFRLPTNHCV